MKHLLIFLLAFPFFASAQILEKQFVATVQYNGFTQINDSLYRGDLIEFRDVLIEGYQPSGVDSGFICLDGTGRAYRVEVVNSFDYSSLNVDLIELDDYDKIPVGVGIVAERYGSTYQIPNGLVNSIGISSVLQAKILNHNTKIAATTVQPPDTLYLQELSGTTAISDGDTIPLIDYVRVVDTPTMLLNYPSTAGYGIIDGGKTWRADTTSPNGLATRKYAILNPTAIANTQLAYSNGTNLVGSPNVTYASSLLKLKNTASTQTLRVEDAANAKLYTAITSRGFGISRSDGALGASGFMYSFGDGAVGLSARNNTLLMNDTRGILQVTGAGVTIEIGAAFNANLTTGHPSSILDVLSTVRGSRPFPIMSTAQADAITGAQGLFVYENGLGPRWYNGARKAYALESTFNRGTATRIPFFDANGQIVDNAGLTWDNTNKYMYINTPTPPSPIYHLNITSTGTISQRWLGMYNSSNIIQSAFTSDVSGNGAVHVYNNVGTLQGKFSSGDLSFLVGKMVFGNTVIASGSDFLVQLRQTDIGLNARINIGGSGGGFPGVGYNVNFSASSDTYTRKGTGVAYFLDFGSNSRFSMKTAPSAAAASTITWAEPLSILNSTNFVGINQTNPQRQLHVTGEARITDLTTDTPTRIVGADADGDLGAITVSTGLDLTSGVLTATGATTWLKTELEASRDVVINGGSSTDFRIQNTRNQFDGKTKIGSDSSFVHDPSQDTTFIGGTAVFGKQSSLGRQGVSGYPFVFRNPSAASTTLLIESGRTSPTGGEAALDFRPSGIWGATIGYGTTTSKSLLFYNYNNSRIVMFLGSSGFVSGNSRTVIVGGIDDPAQWSGNGGLVVYDTITSGKALFLAKKVSSSSTPLAMFSSGANDRFTFDDNGTSRFHTYGQGNKEAADLSKTQSSYIAGFATDGTLLDYPLSSLGNGIYGGSGTLSQHTTRARIPDDGNFLISQLFNSDADSAYIQVINGLDGNREVRLGVTDTMSTGFATLVLKQDTDNEVMSWQLRSSDNEGQTVLEGDGGNISASVDEGYEFQISGMVRAKREAYSEITSTSSPQTLSNTYSDNLINQGGTQATFTLNMPASPDDGQVCTITFNNAITTLTIDGNGETIVGSAVVTGVPGSQRKFKFYSGIGWIKLY